MVNEILAGSMAPRSSYLLLRERLGRQRALGATGDGFVLRWGLRVKSTPRIWN